MYIDSKKASVKAFKSMLNKTNHQEWGIAFNSNPKRKDYYNGEYIRNTFFRISQNDASYGNNRGATKNAHLLNHLCILRYMLDGVNFGNGNQMINQIEMYKKATDAEKDIFAPIFRYGMQRGDKATAFSDSMLNELYIVTQKAVDKGDLYRMCQRAEELNRQHNCWTGKHADVRYNEIMDILRKYRIRDVDGHDDNSGVIFDYAMNCYKAVVLDYGFTR